MATCPTTLALCLVLIVGGAMPAWSAEPPRGPAATDVPPGLPELAKSPQRWPGLGLVTIPERTSIPAVVHDRAPRLAETARQQPFRLRPSRDLPMVAWDSGLSVPAPWLAPSGPGAYAVSPDPARLTAPWPELAVDAARATATSDATQEDAARRMLTARPELRPLPTPFLKLVIPDPFADAETVRLKQPPADAHAPAFDSEMPLKPLMPVMPVEKK